MEKDVEEALSKIQKQLDILNAPNAQQKANRKYLKSLNTLSLRFKNSEIELWTFVKEQPNSTQYIKDLIVADMKKKKKL